MFLLYVLRFSLIAILIFFILTQVVVPLLSQSTLFPMFRKTRTSLLSEISEIRAQLDDSELETTLTNLKEQLKVKQLGLTQEKPVNKKDSV